MWFILVFTLAEVLGLSGWSSDSSSLRATDAFVGLADADAAVLREFDACQFWTVFSGCTTEACGKSNM